MKLSRLELQRLHRPYEDLGGAYRSECESLDFVIDGERLSVLLDGDLASRLGWRLAQHERDPAWNRLVIEQLLLRGLPDFPEGRYVLYVCPECADLGCGAVTAVIERDGVTVVWRDFGWQTNYEDEVYRDNYRHVGPFRFDPAEYERVLETALRTPRE